MINQLFPSCASLMPKSREWTNCAQSLCFEMYAPFTDEDLWSECMAKTDPNKEQLKDKVYQTLNDGKLLLDPSSMKKSVEELNQLGKELLSTLQKGSFCDPWWGKIVCYVLPTVTAVMGIQLIAQRYITRG